MSQNGHNKGRGKPVISLGLSFFITKKKKKRTVSPSIIDSK